MASTADILRAAADLVERTSDRDHLVQIWPIPAITSTAPDVNSADQAVKTLARHLGYEPDRNPLRDLARWSTIRNRAEIVTQMRAAADSHERGA